MRSWLLVALALTACEGSIADLDAAPADGSARDAARADAASDEASAPEDAADVDAQPDGGPVDPCADRIFCEDFETYDVGGPPGGPWEVSTSRATVAIDEARATSGSRAVRIATEGGDGSYRRGYLTLAGAPVFPVPENTLHGRMMIYVAQLPGVGQRVHWTNVQAEGPIPGMESITALYRYGGMNDDRWLANYETRGAGSDCWRNSDTAMQAARWVCMEWRFSEPEDRMQLWVDGVEIGDAAVTERGDGCVDDGWDGNWYGGAWDRIALGWEHYQQSIAHEVWIDDVVIDDAPIGCPAP